MELLTAKLSAIYTKTELIQQHASMDEPNAERIVQLSEDIKSLVKSIKDNGDVKQQG